MPLLLEIESERQRRMTVDTHVPVACTDAITSAGIWRDDAQVVMLQGGGKVYTQPNGITDPGLVVSLRDLS